MFNSTHMRFTKALLLSVVFICTALFSANAQPIQKTSATSPAVLSVDGEDVSLEEFENIFRKNNRDSVVTKASLDEYMELFINFKLKVHAAKAAGLDTVSKFKYELQGYRAQLARPYLTDQEKLDELMQEAYAHLKEEVRASHLLIECKPNALAADTLKAYNKIMDIRKKILAGESFESAAKKYSTDKSVEKNNGDLGYFTAFQMVYPFESAAYNTKIGEVTMPVRTQYGYHLLKVTGRRPARGEIHVAHIMVKPKKEDANDPAAEAKINEIYQKALEGKQTFQELCALYSEDVTTKNKGGELPWFGTNKMVSEFEEASYALKEDGEVSRPFKTSYGWHIVKRLAYKPLASFESMSKDIKAKVSKDARAEKTKNSFLSKIGKEYNFVYNQKYINKLAAKADSSTYVGQLKARKGLLKKVFCEVAGTKYTVNDFYQTMINRKGANTNMNPQDYVKHEAKMFAEDKLMREEDAHLEEKYAAFRLLMKEYREGILLFELTDQLVWSKAVKDTVGLNNYFESNKASFMWPDRAEVVLYTCANEDIANKLRKMLESGKSPSEAAAELNQGTQLNLQTEGGLFAREDREVLGKIKWTEGLSVNVPMNGQVMVVDIEELLNKSPKKLSESRGLVTSEYQNFLDKMWVEELRKTHTFKVNTEVLHSIAK
jgi:peptidyl-prolyl cis-trans isomerase SurA